MEPNDIFISYAWADNEPPVGATSPRDRWVWQFETALTQALRSKLGQPRQVWIDRREMPANGRIEKLLEVELQRSRLLVVLMSPNWAASEWCRMELEAFLAAHPAAGVKESVFVVEIEPVPRERWHARLRELAGFPFNKPLERGKGNVRLGYPLPDPKLDRDFYLDVVILAQQIANELESPGRVADLTIVAPPAADPPAQVPLTLPPRERVVWIAEPTDDLLRRRRELQECIVKAGFHVVAPTLDGMLRASDAPLSVQLQRSLGRAGLFVQLLGPHAGRAIDEAGTRSWAAEQAEAVRAMAAQERWPRMVWRDIGTRLDAADEAHHALLAGAVEQHFEELRREVLRLLPAQRAPPPAPSAADGAAPSVCVTCSEEDERLSGEVVRMLDQLGAMYVEFVNRVGAPDKAEDQALSNSAGVVIVYGAADSSWMITKVQHATQLRGRRERTWGALVDAPLPPERPPAPRVRAIERHDWASGPQFDLMQRFVQSLTVASGHV